LKRGSTPPSSEPSRTEWSAVRCSVLLEWQISIVTEDS